MTTDDERIGDVLAALSAERMESDVRTLVGFGTRHTLSLTDSPTRGIGAARRWVRDEFERIASTTGGRLEIHEQAWTEPGGRLPRIPDDVEIINVLGILPGSDDPPRYLIISGDVDSRATDIMDATTDAPGANDNATGVSAVLEAARVLSSHSFGATLVFAALSGEEQGLVGGRHMAQQARADGWAIDAVLNNDMIGNTNGIDGITDNRAFRIFSEPTPVTEADDERTARRAFGGEVDGPSRQLARAIERVTRQYVPASDPMMIARLDRFGRGGHHRPFNDAGFPAVRIMEAHEHFDRQHEDVRTENGVAYGDVIDAVDFDYASLVTSVNVAALATLGWAPPAPTSVEISGAGTGATTVTWQPVTSDALAAYKLYWRLTTEPQWSQQRDIDLDTTHTLDGIVIDNYVFGVAAIDDRGNESVVSFGKPAPRR
ncbi:MAG TPA: M20/M25/M40 family metallo-hydrolase [Dehalococcoidia bacterium]|nr:M20/M25/M40 family metallo-hydrolase [Dehalococcoidia bacterium]